MDNHKKLVVWIAVIAVIIVTVLLFWLTSRKPETPAPEIITTTDPDTGDEIITVQGKEPEFDPEKGPTIFGGAKLLDQTVMTEAQYEAMLPIVTAYARQNVGQDVTAVKFLPETVETTASTPSGVPYQYKLHIKTEGPVAQLNATINLVGLDRIKIVITYPDKPEVGTFDSGIQPLQGGAHDDGDE